MLNALQNIGNLDRNNLNAPVRQCAPAFHLFSTFLCFAANAPPRTNYSSSAYLSARDVDENMLP